MIDELLTRCGFPDRFERPAVTCAVSGGADSLALLLLARAAGLAVTAVHVDHGLRIGSDREAAAVAAVCERIGAEFRAERVVVAPGPNLEARARAARYDALPADVLTGHTADDQAETVLLHLLRGAGLDGLAAMSPLDPATGRCRPLLGIRRRETVALCAANGLDPLHDPSNDDVRFTRNRVRSEVLPLLDSVARRDVAAVLARQAPILRDEAELLDAMAGELDPTDAKLLAGAPPALARRAIRRWLTASLPSGYPPDAGAVERVLVVARGNRVACELAGGWRVERHRRVLRVVAPGA